MVTKQSRLRWLATAVAALAFVTYRGAVAFASQGMLSLVFIIGSVALAILGLYLYWRSAGIEEEQFQA